MREKFKPIDYLSFIYFFIVGVLIVFFNKKVEKWYFYIIFYSLYIIFIITIAHFYFKFPQNKILFFIRMFYPILTFIFVYKSIEGYVLILHNKFLDEYILKLEDIIFGINPVLELQKIVSKPLTEFLKFSYFSYYFYVPVPALILFFQKKYKELEEFVFKITFTFYICYIGFVIYPVQGPWFQLKDAFYIKNLDGWIITKLQDFIMAKGAVRGACMPSSHLAVAWVSLFLIKKYFGKLPFFIILPLTVSMSFAIVYNRYHYFTDAVAGVIFGFVCYQLSKKLFKGCHRRAALK